ncbi:MAG: hypothetical protein ACOCXA_07795, partial [Planctomycetota bacterium]
NCLTASLAPRLEAMLIIFGESVRPRRSIPLRHVARVPNMSAQWDQAAGRRRLALVLAQTLLI